MSSPSQELDRLLDSYDDGQYTNSEFCAHLLRVLAVACEPGWVHRLSPHLKEELLRLARKVDGGEVVTFVGGEQQFEIPKGGARIALKALGESLDHGDI